MVEEFMRKSWCLCSEPSHEVRLKSEIVELCAQGEKKTGSYYQIAPLCFVIDCYQNRFSNWILNKKKEVENDRLNKNNVLSTSWPDVRSFRIYSTSLWLKNNFLQEFFIKRLKCVILCYPYVNFNTSNENVVSIII